MAVDSHWWFDLEHRCDIDDDDDDRSDAEEPQPDIGFINLGICPTFSSHFAPIQQQQLLQTQKNPYPSNRSEVSTAKKRHQLAATKHQLTIDDFGGHDRERKISLITLRHEERQRRRSAASLERPIFIDITDAIERRRQLSNLNQISNSIDEGAKSKCLPATLYAQKNNYRGFKQNSSV